MTRGVVTIATGNERYYRMACNLLYSIRLSNPQLKVAIITDKNNKYISEFDNVVILEKPNKSYMDKIDLLINCPYDENIFIDADSLVYSNIDYLWKKFASGSDFSCFGEKLSLDSKEGYFDKEDVGEYTDKLKYITRLHGGLYFIRRGEYCRELWELCQNIKNNYSKYSFRMFKQPADEPIIALACAVKNVELIPRLNDICFYPVVSKVKICKKSKSVEYKEQKIKYRGCLIHFGNVNTEKPLYLFEKERLTEIYKYGRSDVLLYGLKLKYYYLLWKYYLGTLPRAKNTIYEIMPAVLKKIYHYYKER